MKTQFYLKTRDLENHRGSILLFCWNDIKGTGSCSRDWLRKVHRCSWNCSWTNYYKISTFNNFLCSHFSFPQIKTSFKAKSCAKICACDENGSTRHLHMIQRSLSVNCGYPTFSAYLKWIFNDGSENLLMTALPRQRLKKKIAISSKESLRIVNKQALKIILCASAKFSQMKIAAEICIVALIQEIIPTIISCSANWKSSLGGPCRRCFCDFPFQQLEGL